MMYLVKYAMVKKMHIFVNAAVTLPLTKYEHTANYIVLYKSKPQKHYHFQTMIAIHLFCASFKFSYYVL